jgi:hypothetical protein
MGASIARRVGKFTSTRLGDRRNGSQSRDTVKDVPGVYAHKRERTMKQEERTVPVEIDAGGPMRDLIGRLGSSNTSIASPGVSMHSNCHLSAASSSPARPPIVWEIQKKNDVTSSVSLWSEGVQAGSPRYQDLRRRQGTRRDHHAWADCRRVPPRLFTKTITLSSSWELLTASLLQIVNFSRRLPYRAVRLLFRLTRPRSAIAGHRVGSPRRSTHHHTRLDSKCCRPPYSSIPV